MIKSRCPLTSPYVPTRGHRGHTSFQVLASSIPFKTDTRGHFVSWFFELLRVVCQFAGVLENKSAAEQVGDVAAELSADAVALQSIGNGPSRQGNVRIRQHCENSF